MATPMTRPSSITATWAFGVAVPMRVVVVPVLYDPSRLRPRMLPVERPASAVRRRRRRGLAGARSR